MFHFISRRDFPEDYRIWRMYRTFMKTYWLCNKNSQYVLTIMMMKTDCTEGNCNYHSTTLFVFFSVPLSLKSLQWENIDLCGNVKLNVQTHKCEQWQELNSFILTYPKTWSYYKVHSSQFGLPLPLWPCEPVKEHTQHSGIFILESSFRLLLPSTYSQLMVSYS